MARLLAITPNRHGIDQHKFEGDIEACIRGFVVCPDWSNILAWTQDDVDQLNELTYVERKFENIVLHLRPAVVHLLQHYRRPSAFTRTELSNLARRLVEDTRLATICAPLPDNGRPPDFPLQFLTRELALIWVSHTKKPVRRTGSKPGEFGAFIVKIVELLLERKLLKLTDQRPKVFRDDMIRRMLSHTDRTKARSIPWEVNRAPGAISDEFPEDPLSF